LVEDGVGGLVWYVGTVIPKDGVGGLLVVVGRGRVDGYWWPQKLVS
jgi:hypothetical protein